MSAMTPIAGMTTGDDAGCAPRLVIALGDALNPNEAGHKAHNLARLHALGVAVPDAVVITNDTLQMFLDRDDLRSEIARTREDASRSKTDVQSVASIVAGHFARRRLPHYIADALDAAAAPLASDLMIVRSSAIGEDSLEASFAGQLDSIPGVTGGLDLHQAVLSVWASRWSSRTLSYEAARDTAIEGMGVIVQRQIDAAYSGVLFTESPDDCRRMLVEYCPGSGEALVCGRANPGRFTLDRESFDWREHARPEAASADLSHLLNAHLLRALRRSALTIERALDAPQDIEWVVDRRGSLWFVQSRPITTRARQAMPPVKTEPGFVCWSNANVAENFPAPITPLLYSIAAPGYYHYFRNLGRSFGIARRRLEAMERPLRQIIGVHGGRMYYNLTSIHAVLRSAPCGEMLARSFNQFVGAEHTSTDAAISFTRRTGTLRQAFELAVITCRTAWQYLFLSRRVTQFERTVAAFAAKTDPARLQASTATDLLDYVRQFQVIRNERWNDAALADAGSMVCYGLLQRLLARAFPGDDQQALHNSLLKALPGLVSGIPALKIAELAEIVKRDDALRAVFDSEPASIVLATIRNTDRFPELRELLDRFLDEWGFRCSGELMLTVPSFQENPEPLIELIRGYVRSSGESPVEVLRRQAAQRVQETERVRAELHRRRILRWIPRRVYAAVVMRVLRATQACICLRERARLKQALLYSRLRQIVLALGGRLTSAGRLDRADDIFFLTAAEIDALVSGTAMFPAHERQIAALRRDALAVLSKTTPPDSIRLPRGEYCDLEKASRLPGVPGDAGMRSDRTCNTQVLRGVGACGGVASAHAAVLAEVTESERLIAGNVLVTRQTDPGWGAVFPLISGLVVERGGMLSHGAIIAREFGIPSVVGVPNATERIAHGARIVVDGDRGLVTVGGVA
jgi:phosphohistidine swiveling domain-containing protein